jgi:hypothetical protein
MRLNIIHGIHRPQCFRIAFGTEGNRPCDLMLPGFLLQSRHHVDNFIGVAAGEDFTLKK